FLEQNGVGNVPRVVAYDPQTDAVLLTWIDGTPIDQVRESDLASADNFLTAVHCLRDVGQAQALPYASGSCLSGAEIERQIRKRLRVLSERCGTDEELTAFIKGSFVPLFERVLSRAQDRYRAAGLDFAKPVARRQQSLVPGDFGFHNALRRTDGSLVFLDFD